MSQPPLPKFVFMENEDSYRTGEIVAWLPEHCMVRFDYMMRPGSDEAKHPPLSGLVPLSELESDTAIFFNTRAELDGWLAYLESSAPLDETNSGHKVVQLKPN